jgi:hypothetical protein
MDSVDPFGTGLIRPLIETRTVNLRYTDGTTETVTVPSLLDIKALIENDLPVAIRKWARFKTIYGPKGKVLTDDWIKKWGKTITGLEDVLSSEEITPQSVRVEPSRGFEPFLDYLENRFIEGCQNPVGRIFTSPGFTEATSRVGLLVSDRKVVALQRQLKRTTEREVFWPVLEQAGYDPRKVDARLIWKPKDRLEVSLKDLLSAVYPFQPPNKEQGEYKPALSIPELRDNMTKLTGIELEEKEVNENENANQEKP